MQKMVELAKKMAARDTAFSHLLLFMLKLCRHWFCEVLVTVLEIAIGIMTAYTYFGVLLWVVCALLVLLMIGSGLCKAYDLCVKANREDEVATLREENKLLLMAKNSATDLNGKAAKYIYIEWREKSNMRDGFHRSVKCGMYMDFSEWLLKHVTKYIIYFKPSLG